MAILQPYRYQKQSDPQCVYSIAAFPRTNRYCICLAVDGNSKLACRHRTDEFTMRFLAAPHESFHCISAHRSKLDHRAKTALETISDVGAVNEALRIGIDTEYLIALADWRALRFASGLADVVAGRVNGKSLYSRAFPSHMSTVAINRLLAKGPLDSYEQIERLALSSTPEGLYGQRKEAQKFLTRMMLLFKNAAVKQKFPNASIHDADDILSMIGAPEEMIEAVRQSVSRYIAMLDCRRVLVPVNGIHATGLACRQSNGSISFAGQSILGVGSLMGANREMDIGAMAGERVGELARRAFSEGEKITIPSRAQHHLDQGKILRIAAE